MASSQRTPATPNLAARPRPRAEVPPSSQAITEPALEAECVPFLAERVVFLPILAGATLRRMLFLPVPLQMLY